MNDVIRIAIWASVQSMALALCIGAILAAARIRSGSVRHAAWLAVLCGMMLMPLLPRVTPKVQVPIVLPTIGITNVQPAPQTVETPPQRRALATKPPVVSRNLVVAPRPSQPVSHPVSRTDRIPWSAIGLGVYAAGLLFLLGCLVPGWRVANQIARSCTPVSVPVPVTGVSVCESSLVNTPLTVGLISPRIVLPTSWREWTGTKLEAVLAHESAHVRNHDALVNLAACLNRCVFWFHPLAWWLRKKLATTAEHASDEAGARAVGDGKEYARVLLDVAAVIGPRTRRYALVNAGMRGDGGLEDRVERILRGDALGVVSPARKAIVAAACAIAIVAIPACRQASATATGTVRALMPEVLALIYSPGIPWTGEFRSQLETVRRKLGQSNDINVLVANGQALVKRFDPNFAYGGEANEAGRAALMRAVTLDPRSVVAREAQVSAEMRLLMSAPMNWHWTSDEPETRKRLAYIAGALMQSTDENFLNSTAAPMISIDWPPVHPNSQGMRAVGGVFAVGKAAVERSLKLNPDSIWARQLMVKVRDHELAVSLPENIWNGTLEGRRRAIEDLPVGERFRELSILAAAAGNDAMREMTDEHRAAWPMPGHVVWQLARDYAKEALSIAPQAKDDPDYGTSIFRADMVAATYAILASDKATALEFARQAMEAPPTEALRYPIGNVRPWSGWHYPQLFIAQLLRQGDRDAAIDIVERYRRLVIADRNNWDADLELIRRGGTPAWAQWPWY